MLEGRKRVLENQTNQDARKKKRFVEFGKPNAPPKTATMLRLEKLLDEDPTKIKKNRKMKPQVPVQQRERKQLAAQASVPRPKNVLAFRGGLASASTFKKATTYPPRSSRKAFDKKRSKSVSPSGSFVRDKEEESKILARSNTLPHSVESPSDPASSETVQPTPSLSLRDDPSAFPVPASAPVPRLLTGTLECSTKNESVVLDNSTDLPCKTSFSGEKVKLPDTKQNEERKKAMFNGPTDPVSQKRAAVPPIMIGLKLGRSQNQNSKSGVYTDRRFTQASSTAKESVSLDAVLPYPTTLQDDANQEHRSPESGIPTTIEKASSTDPQGHSLAAMSKRPTRTPLSSDAPKEFSNRQRSNVNENYVRLNLRNSAGACRGARNKKQWRRKRRFDDQYGKHGSKDNADEDNDDGVESTKQMYNNADTSNGQVYVSRMTGLDPMDDYVDGVFGKPKSAQLKTRNTPKKSSSQATTEEDTTVPMCARHQRPCKLVVVKKNTKGNKGRKFYACSMPRGEQCDHFEWAEDTIEAARKIIHDNSSHSSFIARQVAAHVDRFRSLTVPELKDELSRRGLEKNGKKSQLLVRLAVWARDEIIEAVPYPEGEDNEDKNWFGNERSKPGNPMEIEFSDSDSDGDSTTSESSDELEILVDTAEVTDELSRDDAEDDKSVRPNEKSPQRAKLLSTLRSTFGHSHFREGQEWAIERCLAGKKSLLIAPTGFGKSLCYSLPAALLDGICVVVSPLISLIQDQLRSLPPRIPAATLSGSVSASATAAILDDVVRQRIKILFVSPERLTSPSFRRLFNHRWNSETQQQERKFPDISLLCIDEAHCVSQWAHNFRPCFLRFKGLLELMKPKSILAVTATAGPRVIQDIAHTLGIESDSNMSQSDSEVTSDNVLIINKPRDNIKVSCQFVETHEERLDMLSKILKPGSSENGKTPKSAFEGSLAKGSVIVYVWRQRDTEVVAENLVSTGVQGGIVMYHGGMDASARSKAQSKFMRGKARICVATVAFGMGIDKADVQGVIHLYLSSSPEHFLQEIGRAGRDGRQAQAIALPSFEEIPLRHSLAHSNFISKCQIMSLLYSVKRYIAESIPEGEKELNSMNIGLPVEEIVSECDCKVETVETLLSIIEQQDSSNALLRVQGFNYDKATVALKKKTLEALAVREPVASCIQRTGACCELPIGSEKELPPDYKAGSASFQRGFLAYSRGIYTFSVAKCANALGPTAESRHVFAALRRLQSEGELELSVDASSKGRVLLARVSQLGHLFFADEKFSERAEQLCCLLHDSFSSSLISGARKLLDLQRILSSLSQTSEVQAESSMSIARLKCQEEFENQMRNYFSQTALTSNVGTDMGDLPASFSKVNQREIENDLYALIRDLPLLLKDGKGADHVPVFGDSKFADYTAVAAAKFLHGLDSIRAPSKTFRSHPLFGKWRQVQFSMVHDAIAKLLTKTAGK